MTAGACMLSAGLLVASSGGALASADTGSDPTSDPTPGINQAADGLAGSVGATPTRPATTIVPSLSDALRDSLQSAVRDSFQRSLRGVTGTVDTLSTSNGSPYVPLSPKTTFGGSPTVYGTSGPVVPATELVPPVTDPILTGTEPVAPTTNVVPPVTQLLSPVTNTLAASTVPASQMVPPPAAHPDPFAAASKAMAPLTDSILALAVSMGRFPGVLVGLPTSPAPLADVLVAIERILASMVNASVSLAQLPSNLTELLGIPATDPTSTIGTGVGVPRSRSSATTTAPPTAPGWSAVPQLPFVALPSSDVGPSIAPLPAPAVPLDVTSKGILRGETGTGSAQVVAKGVGGADMLSTVEHVIGAFVATISLTALAAVALPGILGLLTTCAAGIRVGYRQAKAGSVLPNTVISRFVGSGPIGVVRSGAQVELRSRAPRAVRAITHVGAPKRALRVVRSEPAASAGLLERAV